MAASQPTPDAGHTGPAALLGDAEIPRPQRVQAAIDLLNLTDPKLSVPPLLAALQSPASMNIVLEAIAEQGSPPEELWAGIHALATSPAGSSSLAQAIASFRSPGAARLLIAMTHSGGTRDLRDLAALSLSELVGHPFLGYDFEAREAWIGEASGWDDGRWRVQIRFAQRDLLARERLRAERAERRLVDFARQTWIRTPEPEREGVLGELLSAEIDALRVLAAELIRELIASGKAIPESIQNRAIAMLSSDSAEIRAEAATLVVQIAPQSAGPAVLRALLQERNPRAAAPLLEASTRWPTPEIVEPVALWLERGGPIASVAADAALTLSRADLLSSPEIIERFRVALRQIEPAHLNASACRLLVDLGGDSDRAYVQSLLFDDRPALRLSAATALVTRAAFVGSLLEAAARDPQLIDAAARAVETHRPTSQGVVSLDVFYEANPQSVVRAQLSILRTLPIAEVMDLSERLLADPCRAAISLGVIAERSIEPDSTPEFIAARTEGIEQFASAQFRCGQFSQVIATLSQLDPGSLGQASGEILARACIRTGDFQAALDRAPPIAIWLQEQANSDATDEGEQRAALTAFIIQNLGESLSEEVLLALQQELAAANPEKPDLADADPPRDFPVENPGGGPE